MSVHSCLSMFPKAGGRKYGVERERGDVVLENESERKEGKGRLMGGESMCSMIG